MSLYTELREKLFQSLLGMESVETQILQNVVLEQPKDKTHGDLATNAAMVLTKVVGKPPRILAEELVSIFEAWDAVEKASVAGPGFVNISLKNKSVFDDVLSVQDSVEPYLEGAEVGKGTKTIVEYVSINPTGPIHVGHGRNAAFGDAIAKMLEKAGHFVHREYLVNDAGGQIRVLVNSLHARYLQLFGKDIEVPADGYPGDYLIDIAKNLKEKDGDKWLNVSDSEVLLDGLRGFAVEACMDLIRADLAVMGVKFDRFFSELDMHRESDIMARAVAILREKGYIYEGVLPPPKGKEMTDYVPVKLTLFKATACGLGEDQPVYKRNGEPTYFGQDIGYHYDKYLRGFRKMVTVIGADQAGSFTPLAKALSVLTGKDDIYQPVAYEMVKVLRNGEPVRMSKRAGNFVLLKQVLDEVGKDVFRFMMLTVKPTTPLTFDVAKAIEKTMENPVFYVQYAHARLASLERLAAEDLGVRRGEFNEGGEVRDGASEVRGGGAAGGADLDMLPLVGEAGLDVAKTLMMYPQVFEQSVRLLEPHRLVTYAREVAAAVHRWYADVRMLDKDDLEGTRARLELAARARYVLADLLDTCGVAAPERM